MTQIGPNIDGGYYTDIAQHVRDGDGLKTDISLYHQGFEYFPHPTAIYPLWPWVYGMASRFSSKPILVTGINLATFFFFLSLIFGYLWANQVFPEPIFPEYLPGFTAGHVFVLMLASHQEYYIFTSQPYTEGIAYALLFAGAWRFSHLFVKGGLASGFEVGLWLGLIFLARYQLIITAMATFPALAGACFWHPNRKRAIQMFVASIFSFSAILGVHFARISYLFPTSHDLLSNFHQLVPTETIFAYIKDRAKGFTVAFSLYGRYAFARSFRLLHYSLLLSIPFLILDLHQFKRQNAWSRLSEIIRKPRTTFLVFVILFCVGGWLSIHTIHKDYHAEWNFARRQGLTCLLIFFLAMMYLLRHKNFWPVLLGVLLLTSSTVIAYIQYSVWAKQAAMNSNVLIQLRLSEKPHRYKKLVQFLLNERKKREKLTVVWTAHQPQLMAPYIPDVGFHWIYDKTTFEDVKIMFDELGADYLLFAPVETHHWKFRRNSHNFDMAFDMVKNLSGFRVFVRRKYKKNEEVKPMKKSNDQKKI